ncbi:hypothetical protein RKD35_002069 [Streptomyces albogriseolus]
MDDHTGSGQRRRCEQRGGDGRAEAGEQHGQGPAAGPFRAVRHAGAQHRRPQGDQGSGHGEADPAEQVDHLVGEQQPFRQVTAEVAAGHEDAQRGARGQQGGGGDVVAHGHGEPSGQRPAQEPHQPHGVGGDGGRDQTSADEHGGPSVEEHAPDHGDGPRVQAGETQGRGRAPVGLRQPQH